MVHDLSCEQDTINQDDLSVLFQPIVSLNDRKVFAHEALVRCRTPGLESPITLFEHAVANEYCGWLGRLIRKLAVKLSSGRRLFLNVHPIELVEHWLVQPDDPIFNHDSDIYLEITESVPFLHYDLCHYVLDEIRQRGFVYLVVDDLGAGYSNFKRIVDIAPEVVKLDRALVTGVHQFPRQRIMIRALVRMCEELDATVVAEGIETQDEFNALIDCGVQYGQGFLLAYPAYPFPAVTWPPQMDRV